MNWKQFLRDRASEASTWRGVVLMVTAANIVVTPEQQDALVAAGLAVAGLIGAFFPDTTPKS